MNVRGVYTSDIQYQASTLPKDVQLRVPKDSDWFSQYNWFQYPADKSFEFDPNDELAQTTAKVEPS